MQSNPSLVLSFVFDGSRYLWVSDRRGDILPNTRRGEGGESDEVIELVR